MIFQTDMGNLFHSPGKRIRLILVLLFTAVLSFQSFAQGIVLNQSHECGIYKRGEKIEMHVTLNELDIDSISVKIWKNFDKNPDTRMYKYTGKNMCVLSAIFDQPTALVCEVSAEDQLASLGLVVEPEGFEPGAPRPKDIDKFWNNEKKKLRTLPFELNVVAVDGIEEGYTCSAIEINTNGPKPARGYFAKPDNAKPGSLPIVLQLHAAGVKGSWCLSQPENAMKYAKMEQGALCFDLNAHGMLVGQPQEYYDELEKGELKDYAYQGMESREGYYFSGMYLRLIRTLDYLCSQPEWDGERILEIGESQGGGQALAAAGLDSRVSAVVAIVPAMCDWSGPLAGRKGGWPNAIGYNIENLKVQAAVPYYDAANLLKGSKATIFTEIGFIDTTCPSTSVYAAVNQAKGEKIIIGVPYRAHQLHQESYQKEWEEKAYKPRMEFIADFLK
ncbi:MAG: acetylxylan esterase [Bacteroidales bacterium]|jgi:cephalosporin-C deacetylase|nr:acetylxylan esterase [Bacteroidales bacterium]